MMTVSTLVLGNLEKFNIADYESGPASSLSSPSSCLSLSSSSTTSKPNQKHANGFVKKHHSMMMTTHNGLVQFKNEDDWWSFNNHQISNQVDFDTGEQLLQTLPSNSYHSEQIKQLIQIGCVCNNAVLSEGQIIGQPTEGAILKLAKKFDITDDRINFTRLQEWPFSSDTKSMTVKCVKNNGDKQLDEQHVYFTKGAVECVLSKCAYVSGSKNASNTNLLTLTNQLKPLTPDLRDSILNEAVRLGQGGLRVLGLAKGEQTGKMVFHGLIGLIDPPRNGVDMSVRLLLESGIRVIMITGDAKETACCIASRLSIYHPGDLSLSGDEVEKMSMDHLRSFVHNVTVFYRSGPKHKCKIVKALQQCDLVVAMTGDGVNDAVALKSSDIGVAMGFSGTDVCREASDLILLDDNFNTIVAAMEEGKSLYHNIKNFVAFQLSTSIAALTIIAMSTLFSLPTPLNAMQILFINILMDGPPAQSLGVEPPDESVVKLPPRRSKDFILDRRLIMNVVLASTTIVTGTLCVFYFELHDGNVTPRDTTMTFTCFVLFDMFNALSFRSQTKSIFSIGLFTNRMFVLAVGLSLFGQLLVIYFPPLQSVFQTEALSFLDLLLLTCISSTVFIISELRKFISRNSVYFSHMFPNYFHKLKNRTESDDDQCDLLHHSMCEKSNNMNKNKNNKHSTTNNTNTTNSNNNNSSTIIISNNTGIGRHCAVDLSRIFTDFKSDSSHQTSNV